MSCLPFGCLGCGGWLDLFCRFGWCGRRDVFCGDVGCVQLVNEVCTLFSVVSVLSGVCGVWGVWGVWTVCFVFALRTVCG